MVSALFPVVDVSVTLRVTNLTRPRDLRAAAHDVAVLEPAVDLESRLLVHERSPCRTPRSTGSPARARRLAAWVPSAHGSPRRRKASSATGQQGTGTPWSHGRVDHEAHHEPGIVAGPPRPRRRHEVHVGRPWAALHQPTIRPSRYASQPPARRRRSAGAASGWRGLRSRWVRGSMPRRRTDRLEGAVAAHPERVGHGTHVRRRRGSRPVLGRELYDVEGPGMRPAYAARPGPHGRAGACASPAVPPRRSAAVAEAEVPGLAARA